MEESHLRIAIINADKCKPKNCQQECKRICPINKSGKLCIEVTKVDKICKISEVLCIGCGLCVKKCPFGAIKIINLPKNLNRDTTHRFGLNSFKLHRLPTPRPGQVLGLVGTNGIGKSTALKILANKLKPNLGNFEKEPEWKDILKYFRGSELQNYFQKILEEEIIAAIKPQYVDSIPKAVKGRVDAIINKGDQKKDQGKAAEFIKFMELSHVLDRDISQLSGGELQRLAISLVALKKVNVYMFDEPSSYLDVKQRLRAAEFIRALIEQENYIICIEHDLSILDYLSDFVCCLYGEPGCYGVVTMPFSVREGINVFLGGFIPTENMRFRDFELTFKITDTLEDIDAKQISEFKYPDLQKTQGSFTLNVKAGCFTSSQIIVMLGENGTGKTTFIKMLAGKDTEKFEEIPELNVSYKPQAIAPKFQGSVRELLHLRIKDTYLHPQFSSDVARPLRIEELLDQEVSNLSGGELQRVAIVLALGKPADVYLIDEPSAYLDSEQRILIARIIKRFIMNSKKSAFIVEHDFIMASYLADLVIVYEGQPGINCTANSPQSLVRGMNLFLKLVGITFRRDPTNFRPRINKIDSYMDREQKLSGNFYCLEE